jgi:hypothetical protein
VYKFSLENPEGKRPFARPRRRCVEWIHLAQVRDRWRALVNMVTKLGVLGPGSYLYYGGGQVYVTDQGCRNNVLVRV